MKDHVLTKRIDVLAFGICIAMLGFSGCEDSASRAHQLRDVSYPLQDSQAVQSTEPEGRNAFSAVPNGTEPTTPALDTINAQEEPKAESDSWKLFRGNPRSNGVTKTELPIEMSVLWRFEVPRGAFESSPVIEAGVLYIGDLDGKVYALELETGETKWEFTTDDKLGFTSSPAIRDDLIYLGDITGLFYCLDKQGNEKWRYQTNGEINSSANFFADNVLFGSQDGTLYCLNARSGEEIWKYEAKDQIRCSPTIVGEQVFLAGCDSQLQAVNLRDGTSLGSIDIESQTGVTPAAAGEFVYFGTHASGFWGINWKEMEVVWNMPVANSIQASPAVYNGIVVFGGHNRTIYGCDAASGEKVWEYRTRGKINASPVISANRVYVGSDDGRVYVFDLKTGELLNQIEVGGEIAGMSAANNRLVLATLRGFVICLGEAE
ncbi:MAG TPA: PQQ-binding-like beta-propeller repeat protein [Pirellulaceae bacterium]|nr:PQQ-binding-like beta-propeller repeat protein [Pirellulaceae bacterium]HMO93165.1 PQQ-binding-like beta-propeller repeat protein [Pirellulaceae bacterium]HMP70006.1 PQQ-binding-like beta-propeller repeat protein [Pirellulaceae bacterium]